MKTVHHSLLYLALTFVPLALVQAQTVSPLPAPTIIKTAPYTINQPGYYQLGADLVVSATSGNIITISASNVTLDFAGHYISGPNNTPSSNLSGVYANEQGNLNVLNGTIAFCRSGIDITGNGSSTSLNINQRVDNMLVTYCYEYAVGLFGASYSEVTNCRVSFIGGSAYTAQAIGIEMANGTGNRATGNTVTSVSAASTGSGYGIYGTNNLYAADNSVDTVTTTATSGYSAAGIYRARFAVGNTVADTQYGLLACTKYEGTLTDGCATPFSGGTAVGTNN